MFAVTPVVDTVLRNQLMQKETTNDITCDEESSTESDSTPNKQIGRQKKSTKIQKPKKMEHKMKLRNQRDLKVKTGSVSKKARPQLKSKKMQELASKFLPQG